MDYFGVTKAAILLFADYSHDRYITNGPSWLKNSWDFVMGSETLVILVTKIWSLGANTISAVKSVANFYLEGYRVGLKLIANAVLGPIIDLIIHILHKVLETFSYISDEFLLSLLNIQVFSDKILINGEKLSLTRNNLDVILTANQMKYTIETIFLTPYVSYETLSPESTAKQGELKIIMHTP